MAARIHLVIAGHLAMSPRGQREALVLREAGYDVTISGIWFDTRQAEIDREIARQLDLRFSPALDLRRRFSTARLAEQLKRRWAQARFEQSQGFSPPLLGYGVTEQLAEARRARADLTIVHSEAGLWIARELVRDGHRVGVDFEDWFSHDLPVSARATRPETYLDQLESEVLAKAAYRIASSQAMARALAKTHGGPEPAVVTNAGQDPAESTAPDDANPLRLHWVSQTIGPARGLELLFAALPFVRESVRVELRGACNPQRRAWLGQSIPTAWRNAVTISPPIAPWDLPARIAEHHVGLALETSKIPSRDVCISNKFFHYLASGLAVIATKTQAQREALFPCPNAGTLINENSPSELAEAIDRYAANRSLLAQARAAARQAAAGPWSGERERDTIIAEAWRALKV